MRPDEDKITLPLVNPKKKHTIADFAWGTGPLANSIFATTCASDDELGDTSGIHKLVDVETLKERVLLGSKDGGHISTFNSDGRQMMTIFSSNYQFSLATPGTQLYLYTKGFLEAPVHTLWIYDIARGNPKASTSLSLNNQGQVDIEVTSITTSPDGLYVALGWDNNQIQIHDSRFLTRGPLHIFSHGKPISSGKAYGIVQMDWIPKPYSSYELVSGGADGQ